MTKSLPIVALAAAASLISLAGCKTVVNNPTPADHTTVIREQPTNTDVTPAQPKVENNIKVDH